MDTNDDRSLIEAALFIMGIASPPNHKDDQSPLKRTDDSPLFISIIIQSSLDDFAYEPANEFAGGRGIKSYNLP
ncbi:hypothetical protein DP113_20325 [Brasilonema octagenarum UFV-E1]|uniref:Uncharacterized protein n=2 Tax=Brasilonema TaxID=383614 RepID=A0A856MI96_9CYAN|nr:hypothetical protein [Brasilonema octagenarum UFV-OR1]QDL09930.1 hypothetical protein DP114_20400 [Brasilonema sennae CENA114]QDL16282.1 hypothetical protein DP113_20325 [Brasilonema octagenarum UFV-E1]